MDTDGNGSNFDDLQRLTSTEVAALILSEGATKDPELAVTMEKGQLMDMDALERSGITREMGFAFEVKETYRKWLIKSTEAPFVSVQAKRATPVYGEEDINALVNGCLALKQKYDVAQYSQNRGDDESDE